MRCVRFETHASPRCLEGKRGEKTLRIGNRISPLNSEVENDRTVTRTNLSIDRKVFEEFSAQAQRKNMSLFAFANESLSLIAKVAAEGGDPLEVYRIWRLLTVLKEVGVITLPSDFVEVLMKQLYLIDKESLLTKFRELGTSVVGLLLIEAKDIKSLSALANNLGFITPIKRFNASEGENESVQVDVVGAGKEIETTECSSEFLKSVLRGYGYEVVKEELHPGAMRLWCRKKGENTHF